jgi:methylenetetrahydrofolate dehydrogenase (NADP+)/methenyltetrahydrofolate cyclohydrolase
VAKILNGKAVAAEVRSEVASEVASLKERGMPVRLDVILAGDDPASVTYVASKERDGEEVGIESRVHRFSADVTQEELSDLVGRLNEDSAVSGFFIQLPLPEGLDPMPLISSINPAKDVDGLSPESVGRLVVGLPSLLPCTPHGVIQLLKRNGIELSGREAVVVGRSNLVGKPLAQLLLRENATVTLCHSRTRDLPEVTRRADILVIAAGKREMVGAEHVGEDAVVVDVGIHRKEGGLVGDVRFDEVEPRAAWISPVPGGVGPMTRAMLLHNTVTAARMGSGDHALLHRRSVAAWQESKGAEREQDV